MNKLENRIAVYTLHVSVRCKSMIIKNEIRFVGKGVTVDCNRGEACFVINGLIVSSALSACRSPLLEINFSIVPSSLRSIFDNFFMF